MGLRYAPYVLTERYRKDEDSKPIGYEAIDAERKKEQAERKHTQKKEQVRRLGSEKD